MAKPETAGTFPQAAADNMRGDENRSTQATEALVATGNTPVPTQPEYNIVPESTEVGNSTLNGTPGVVDYFVFDATDGENKSGDYINGFEAHDVVVITDYPEDFDVINVFYDYNSTISFAASNEDTNYRQRVVLNDFSGTPQVKLDPTGDYLLNL